MLVKFTGFNQTDPSNADQVVELEANDVKAVVSAMTGDRHSYTSITTSAGIFFVKESVSQVMDALVSNG